MKFLRKLLVISSTLMLLCNGVESFAFGETTRVSLRNDLSPPDGMGESPSMSANGRFVAFHSIFPLVAEDKNLTTDIYVHDRLTKLNSRVSVSSSGEEGNSISVFPSISADGRYVAFISEASNLVQGDTNNQEDIFVYDRVAKQTTRVNVSSAGIQANEDPFGNGLLIGAAYKVQISTDGRYIVFASGSNNLVANDTNNLPDIFVRDRLTKQTTRVSINSDGSEGNLGNVAFQNVNHGLGISANGQFVVFHSQLNNLVNGDNTNEIDVFLHNRQTKQTKRVNIESVGQITGNPSISADGRFIAFMSSSESLVPNDTNKTLDVFLYDRLTQKTTRVTVASNGDQANAQSYAPGISADGNFIAFISEATNLTSLPVTQQNVYIHNRLTGKTSIVNVNSQGNQGSGLWTTYLPTISSPSLSADGRYIAFETSAPFLVSGDFNEAHDIFVRDRLLLKDNKADLQVSVPQKPTSLAKNSDGSYVFSITNKGPEPVGTVRVQHLFSNGELFSLTPSKGVCHRYTNISLCNFGELAIGASVTLQTNVKAIRSPLSQQLSISNGGRADPKPGNNYLTINTPVTIP